MNETLHTLTLEILKAKYNLSKLSTFETHKMYREIYKELQKAEKDYVSENPGTKYMK